MIVNNKYLLLIVTLFALVIFSNPTNADANKKNWKEKGWKVSYSGTLEYDDNVVLLPDETPLSGDISDEGSMVGKNALSIKFLTPQSGGELSTSYTYSRSDYEVQDLDDRFALQTHLGTLKYKHPFHIGGIKNKIGLGIIYSWSFLGKEQLDYVRKFSIEASDQINLKQGFSLLSFKVDKNMYENEHIGSKYADRDGKKYTLSGSYYHFLFNKKGHLNGTVSGWHTETQGSDNDHQGVKVSVGLKMPLDHYAKTPLAHGTDFNVTGTAKFLDYYNDNYTEEHTNSRLVKRNDSDYRFSVGVQRELGEYVHAGFKYTHSEETSNIAAYEYDKNVYLFFIKAAY